MTRLWITRLAQRWPSMMLQCMNVVVAVLGSIAVICAWCDARTGSIPNTLTGPGLLLVVTAGVIEPLMLVAGGLCVAVYGAAFVLKSCGGGDVKLAGVVGGAIGSPAAALVAVVVAACVSLVVAALRRRRCTVHGPALVGAAVGVTVLSIITGG